MDKQWTNKINRDVRVQISVWFQTLLLFRKPNFQTFNALKSTCFQAFQIISDFFSQMLSHPWVKWPFVAPVFAWKGITFQFTGYVCLVIKSHLYSIFLLFFVTGTDRPHHVEDALPRGGGGRGMMAHRVITDTGDVLMGTATIPLLKLLANRTGKLWYTHMLHIFLSSSKLGLGIWCKYHFFPWYCIWYCISFIIFTLAHLILSVLPFTPITLYDILPNIIIVKITIPYDMEYFHISYTVKPRPEAHMDMILFEVFLKNIHLIPLDQIVQWHYDYL